MKFLIFVFSLSLINFALADDTYNFYFQKAPGPVTVNQGASTATPQVTPQSTPPAAITVNPQTGEAVVVPSNSTSQPLVPSNALMTSNAAAPIDSGPKKWRIGWMANALMNSNIPNEELLAGKSELKSGAFQGIAIERHLIGALSVFGEYYFHREKGIPSQSFSNANGIRMSRGTRQATWSKGLNYGLGASLKIVDGYVPLRILGASLTATGGIMSLPQSSYSKVNAVEYESNGVTNKIYPFAGPKAQILIADTLSFDVNYRFLFGTNALGRARILQAGVSYLF